MRNRPGHYSRMLAFPSLLRRTSVGAFLPAFFTQSLIYVASLWGMLCAATDVTRYEIENKEKMINVNDKLLILFINVSSRN